MRILFGRSLLPVLPFALALVSGACRGQPQEAPPQGEYTPTATVKDLMLGIIDPSADVVWNSVVTTVSASGTEEKVPRNDSDWNDVRRGAVTLAEATNLLLMPGRHVARPGEKSETPGVELEPEEMEALIEKDRGTWDRMAKDLHAAALATLKAIDAKDPQAMYEVGGEIEVACENCHSHYWYPNQVIPPVPTITTP